MHLTQAELNKIPAKHLKNVMKMEAIIKDAEDFYDALGNLFAGQPVEKAIKNALCKGGRYRRKSSWTISLDDEIDGKSLAEILPAAEADPLETWRSAHLGSETEVLLAVLGGGSAALAQLLGVGVRRAQQIIKIEIENRSKPVASGFQEELFGGVKP